MTEAGGVGDGQFGKHLAIDVYAGLFEACNQAAVGKLVLAGFRVDPHDPQAAKIAFLVATITVSIGKSFLYCFTGGTIQLAFRQPISGREIQKLLAARSTFCSSFYSRHGSSLIRILLNT